MALKIVALLIAILIAESGFSKQVEYEADIAEDLAEQIGEALAEKLLNEHSKVVFLDLAECTPQVKDSAQWCKLFFSLVSMELSKENIRFLSEAQSEKLREKIANEAVYQHAARQVDVKKAVELGKQDAFGAYVTMTVSGSSETGVIYISAQSVNIKAAATTITLSKVAHVKTKTARPWGNIFLGLLLTGSGGYAVDRAVKIEALHKDRASREYSLYRTSEDPAEVVRLRRNVEFEDQAIVRCQAAMAAGGIITLIGLYNLFLTEKEVLDYSLASRIVTPNAKPAFWIEMDFAPLLAQQDLKFTLNWRL
jgi:hypothetical protein